MRETSAGSTRDLSLDRRSLFKIAALGAPAVALTAAPSAAEETAEDGAAGLRKTAHVLTYLDSARL